MIEAQIPSTSGRLHGWAHVQPKIDSGSRKPTPAQRVTKLLGNLVEVVRTEWRTIRALNLGVKSGTGIVDELILQKLDQWVQELHMLCISKDEAADALRKAAKQLGTNDLQQLQVLLDTSNHPELADYIRLVVFNSTDPFVTQPVDVLDSSKPPSTPLAKRSPRAGRRSHAPDLTRPLNSEEAGAAARQGPRPSRQATIRFTGFLPEGHALSRTAYQLHNARLASNARGVDADVGDQADAGAAEDTARMLRDYSVTALLGPCNLREALREPVQPPPPPPMHSDIEARWKDTVHTLQRDPLLNHVMISAPTPTWSFPPDFKQNQSDNPSPSRSPGRHREPNSPTRLGNSIASARGAQPTIPSPTRQAGSLPSAKGSKERAAHLDKQQTAASTPTAAPSQRLGATSTPSPTPTGARGSTNGAAALIPGALPHPSPLSKASAQGPELT